MPAGAQADPRPGSGFIVSPAIAESFDRDDYVVLRGAIPQAWLAPLREAFDVGIVPPEQWPVPRGRDWRHALLDAHPDVRRVARLPVMLGCAWHLLRQPFFVSQVEGREPCPGGGMQALHRDDLRTEGEPEVALALAFLDDFGPDNGATRVVANSLRLDPEAAEAQAVILEGQAGDIVVFDARLLHGGTCNRAGARRRSLLINYWVRGLAEAHAATHALRGLSDEVPQIYGRDPQATMEEM